MNKATASTSTRDATLTEVTDPSVVRYSAPNGEGEAALVAIAVDGTGQSGMLDTVAYAVKLARL